AGLDAPARPPPPPTAPVAWGSCARRGGPLRRRTARLQADRAVQSAACRRHARVPVLPEQDPPQSATLRVLHLRRRGQGPGTDRPDDECLGTRPKSMKCLEISVAAFLGQSVKEVRPPATCAEKRLVGRTSSSQGKKGRLTRRHTYRYRICGPSECLSSDRSGAHLSSKRRE